MFLLIFINPRFVIKVMMIIYTVNMMVIIIPSVLDPVMRSAKNMHRYWIYHDVSLVILFFPSSHNFSTGIIVQIGKWRENFCFFFSVLVFIGEALKVVLLIFPAVYLTIEESREKTYRITGKFTNIFFKPLGFISVDFCFSL